MRSMFNLTNAIDGGYISFIYGLFHNSPYEQARFTPFWSNALVCLDSDPTIRRDIFPDYKIRRKEKRANNEEVHERHQRVRQFREYMEGDHLIAKTKVKGTEADDILAYFYMVQKYKYKVEDFNIMGVDKDLIQVPGMYKHMVDHKFVPVKSKYKKVPAFFEESIGLILHEDPWPPWLKVLYQCLFGDKSDSIPRLLANYNKERAECKGQLSQIFTGEIPAWKRLDRAYQIFEKDLLVNMALVLLPTPLLHDASRWYFSNPQQFFKLIASKEYWSDLGQWTQFHRQIEDSYYEYEEEDDEWASWKKSKK